MASPNVGLVRSIFAACQRGDYSSVNWAHPEIEFVQADGPDPGTWKGLAGLAEAAREFLSAWEEYQHEAEECRELDDERALVLDRRRGRGRTSGLDLGQMRVTGAHLSEIRGGRVTRLVAYRDGGRALADLGLAPEPRSRES